MTEGRFDEAVQSAWGKFESQLEVSLSSLGDCSMVIELEAETPGGGAAPYVQFAGDGDWVRGEVSSNKFLDASLRMNAVQTKSLRALGWMRPDKDHPNWWIEVRRDELELLQTMAMGAIRQALGVVHPKFLVQGAGDTQELSEVPPEYEFAHPSSREELQQLVAGTVARHLGKKELIFDDDGDIPIRARNVPLWVHVLEDVPTVRIFSFLVDGVSSTRQARIEVDILNRQCRQLKFMVHDRLIYAAIDLPMAPFVAQHLRDMLDYADGVLNDIVDDLALRTGGRLWFKDRPSSSEKWPA